MDNRALAKQNKILEIVVGSHLYGLNTPSSDQDFSGVFMPSKEMVLGFERCDEVDLSVVSKKEDGRNDKDAVDSKLYELRKFVKLALENNPNIIEMLFVPQNFPEESELENRIAASVKFWKGKLGIKDESFKSSNEILFMNEEGEMLLNHRHLFPWKGCAQKFLGYAFSQKHKMLIKPDNMKELLEAKEYLGEWMQTNPKMMVGDTKFLEKGPFADKGDFVRTGDLNFQKHVMVKKAMTMVEERLGKVSGRSELWLKHGFDTKFGSHLVRLMVEGKALLETGELQFPLAGKAREDIMAIKQGRWTVKEVVQYSEHLEAQIEQLKLKSDLPGKPRHAEVQKLCMNMIEASFYK